MNVAAFIFALIGAGLGLFQVFITIPYILDINIASALIELLPRIS